MNAATEGISGNPFASLVSDGQSGNAAQSGRENTDPLPNPWAPAGSTGSGTTGSGGTTGTTGSNSGSTTAAQPPAANFGKFQ